LEKTLRNDLISISDNTLDPGCVERIRAGDSIAFELLFRFYYPRLCQFTIRMVRDSAEAEQLVQDIFLNIWQMRESWSPQGPVRSYLYRAARNQALNYLKSHKLDVDIEQPEVQAAAVAQFSLQEDYERKELLVAVQQAIELLPPRCRLVFVLHRQDGLTYSEIADVLDISTKTVETQIGRALKILRKILSPYLALLLAFFHCA
jgi:RNA polymerase sigma-70 factor (ECF subfamily)